MSFWNRATGGNSHQIPVIGDYADYESASISSDDNYFAAEDDYYEDDKYYPEYNNEEVPLPEGPPPTENVFKNVASPMPQRKTLPASLHQFETSPLLQMARKRPVDPVLAQNAPSSLPPSAPGGYPAYFHTPLQSPVLRKISLDPILQQKLASMQAPLDGVEQTPFRTPLQSPSLGGGRKRAVRLSKPGTPLVSPRLGTTRKALVSPGLRQPAVAVAPSLSSLVTPGGTVKPFDPSASSRSSKIDQDEVSEEDAAAANAAVLEKLVIKPLDESSDDSDGDWADQESLPPQTQENELENDWPSDADSGEDSNDVAETETDTEDSSSEHDGNYNDMVVDDGSEEEGKEEDNEIDYVDDYTGEEKDDDDQYSQEEEKEEDENGEHTDIGIEDDDVAEIQHVENEVVEYDELLETPTREQKLSHFVFLSDQKNVPSELKRLQEKTSRRRRELRNQFHDLECQVGLAASKFAEEKMDLGLAIRDTFDRTCCRPLEAAVERIVMERETTMDRRPAVAALETHLSQLDNQMMRHVHVTLSDAKREELDSLRQDLVQEVIPSMRVEKSKADKIEGGVVRRYELNAGNVAKRFHQESAARRAALDMLNRKLQKMSKQEEQRSDDVLGVISNLREQIKREREERIAADKQIMDDITKTAVAMRRAFLAAFDDSTN
jgi:hypothetical protein